MRALTIQEPWLSCILYYGKNVENRCYPLPRKIENQPIALHTGKKKDENFYPPHYDVLLEDSLPLGHIVAIARFTSCAYTNFDLSQENKWAACGQFQWHIEVDRILETPIPARGNPKFWEVPPEVEAAINNQLNLGSIDDSSNPPDSQIREKTDLYIPANRLQEKRPRSRARNLCPINP